jgi:tetratricopeptide (TPR) repeat protein
MFRYCVGLFLVCTRHLLLWPLVGQRGICQIWKHMESIRDPLMVRLRQILAILGVILLIPDSSVAQKGSVSSEPVLAEIQQLIQQGNLAEARSQLTKAIQQFPRQASFYNFLAVIDAQENKYAQAEANFRKAISLTPQYQGPYINLGRLYQEHQATDREALRKALGVYEGLLKIDPSNEEAHYQCAVLLLKRDEYKASLNHIQKLAEAAQSSPQVLAVRCGDLAALGQLSEAETAARQLLSSPDFSEADVVSILPLLERMKLDSLQGLLLEGLAAKGLASAASLHQLGLVYERQGKLEQSRAILEKAAERQTITAPLLLDLARVAYKQKDNKGALGYLAHARDLAPKIASIHFFWGLICMEEQLPVEALKSLREAVVLDPNNPFIHYALGEVILKTKDVSEAISHFQKFCELRPGEVQGKYAVGVAYYASGNYDAARQVFESLAENPKTGAGANLFLARLAKQQGNQDEALRRIELALKADDQFADAYSELGQIQMRRRDYPSAEKAFLKCIEIDRDHYLANLNLLVVYQRTKDPRQEAQAQRFEEVKKKRSEQEQLLLRTIEIRPY